MMEPIVVYTAIGVLTVVLCMGAWEKLANLWLFEAAVSGYGLLPGWLARPFALAFPALEMVACVLLLVPALRAWGALAALLVLGMATAGVVLNLLRGRTEIDCGCGGLSGSFSGLSWWLVVRNACLLALAVTVLMTGGELHHQRDMNWVDGLTLLGATGGLIGLYATFNQLMGSYLRMTRTE